MNHYGYITDKTYIVPDTAITWTFVRYNEDGSSNEYLGIESTELIIDNKVVMFDSPDAFNYWKYQFQPEEDLEL
jgi:hypothetical protein